MIFQFILEFVFPALIITAFALWIFLSIRESYSELINILKEINSKL